MTYVEYLRKVREHMVRKQGRGIHEFLCTANNDVYSCTGVMGAFHHDKLQDTIYALLDHASKKMGRTSTVLTTYWVWAGKFGLKANWIMRPREERARLATAARIAFLDKLIEREGV